MVNKVRMILQSRGGRYASSIIALFLSAFISSRCAAQVPEIANATPVLGELSDHVVKQFVQPFLEDRCHVGLSIVIVHNRETRFHNFGSTSRTKRVEPTPNSIYEIASVTKTLRALWLRKLCLNAACNSTLISDNTFRSDTRT